MTGRRVPFALPLAVLGLVYAGLGARLVQLQVFGARESARAADQILLRTETGAPPRGRILDRRGAVLAVSYPVLRLEASPADATIEGRRDPAAIARVLAPLLGRSVDSLLERIDGDARYRVIARDLRSERARSVREAIERETIAGFRLVEESARAYPLGEVGGHVVGYVNREGKGSAGVEARYDALLRGEEGCVRSARRFAGVVQRSEPGLEGVAWGEPVGAPRPGMDLVLTLDAKVSSIAAEEIGGLVESARPDWVSVVVLDPRDGAVLALENSPRFDPNAFGSIADSRREALRNTAVETVVEPGSVFKPFVYAVALEEGAFDPGEGFDVEGGAWSIGRRIVRDHRTFESPMRGLDVFAHSSNIGMAKIGLRLGGKRLRPGLLQFALGERTGIELPGEAAPRVTRPDRWTEEYTTVSVSFGYEIALSPIRFATSFAAFANGGVVPDVSVVAGILDEEGIFRARRREPGARAVEPAALERTLEAMEEVFRSGTASRLPPRPFRIAGKSGTSKPPGERGPIRYLSSFACFGPVEDPAALVLVMVHDPKGGRYYGSEVAAPAAVNILERTLHHLGALPPASLPGGIADVGPARRVFPPVAVAEGGRP